MQLHLTKIQLMTQYIQKAAMQLTPTTFQIMTHGIQNPYAIKSHQIPYHDTSYSKNVVYN